MDLSTSYMGLSLQHPIIASASPLTQEATNFRRLEDAGAAAIVMFSLFEEQIRHEAAAMEHLAAHGAQSFAEALSYFPEFDEQAVGPDHYLDLLRRGAESVDVPVIGSLNGISDSGWVDYALAMQQAGASAIELNVYFLPTDLAQSGVEVEQRYLDVLRSVKAAVSVPVAVKLSPFFSAPGHMAMRLDEAGADALVLFNRFYQPDFDLDSMTVEPSLELSHAYEMRLPLLWIAVLFGRVQASLAATRGVETADEVVKYLLAGADSVMSTSALLRNGMDYLGELHRGLTEWMDLKGYRSVAEMKGAMSRQRLGDPEAFDRANYIKVLESYRNPYLL